MIIFRQAPRQLPLDVKIRVEKSIDGIEMGVLETGLPYLTQTGLARMTGAGRATIFDLTKEWEDKFSDLLIGKGRNDFLKEYLFRRGYNEPALYMKIVQRGWNYSSCLSRCRVYGSARILRIRGAESQRNCNQEFSQSCKAMDFRNSFYDALQYVPIDKWKYFNDRVSILTDSTLPGYFSIFKEINGLIVDLINAGLPVDDRTLPDISVGQAWGKYWNENDLNSRYGPRIPYEHNYPSYYPQAKSNPQDAWAYLDAALPEFRRWFRIDYLSTKYPALHLEESEIVAGWEARG